ncbi:hypothetical protein GCM10027261_18980 [Geodermatophilus arenarius]|uniref:glycosyltransferase family 4 protein n=1 Tax=Geodermatophilus arenarius TaxID=1137990 RepID=UPI0036D76E39
MDVGVVYATDFGLLSPGGIARFVARIGAQAPSDLRITYYLAGEPAELPRATDGAVIVHTAGRRGPLNARFSAGLWSRRQELARHDVVICHRPEYVPCLPREAKTVLVLHGGSWNAWRFGRRLFGLAYHVAEIPGCALSDLVISVDPASLSRAARSVTRRLVPTRAPVDDVFAPGPKSSNGCRRLLVAARLVPEKRIPILFEVAHDVGLPVTVMGDGPERRRLERLAASLELDTTFLGAVTPLQIRDEYLRGGILAMATKAEGYPLAVAEALSVGVPAVGLHGPGLTQLQPYGLSLFRSPRDLSAGVRALLSTSDLDGRAERAVRAWQDHRAEVVAESFWGHVMALVEL